MLKLSKNEQDYLKTIYLLEKKNGEKSVSIHLIAQNLSVAASSVTEMIKRLSKKNLVLYSPYRGASLSDSGESQARFIIKSHRVWETFLVEKLGYSTDEVHAEAENLEHASSPKLVESLYALLGYPKVDPHGSKIPSELFWNENKLEISLRQAEEGKHYYITNLDEECKTFFKKLKMKLPHFIKILESLHDGSMIVKEDSGKVFLIPGFLQEHIHLVQRRGQTASSLKEA